MSGQSSKQTEEDLLQSGEARHVSSLFMKDSLLSEQTKMKSAASVFPLMPDVAAVQIGGKLIDGGRETLFPALEEIRSNLSKHKMIIATSSGKRARHILAVGEDLGLPVGILAELKRLDTELNSHIVGALLSPYGIAELTHAEMIHVLPAMLEVSRGVVFNGMPPYDLWERLPSKGTRPPTGADAGVLLFALTCGMREVIYLRDVGGIYRSDPKSDSDAELIPNSTAKDMLEFGPEKSCVDREVFELMAGAKNPIRIHVVSGLVDGALTGVIEGRKDGTTVTN